MKTTPMILAMAFVASAMVAPVSADTPGNYSVTFEFLVVSYFDFKDGVGIYDSGDVDNEFSICVLKLLGLRGIQPLAITWEGDQNIGTNLNGPAVGVSDLGIGAKPGGFDTDIPCPTDIGGTGADIFITWSGMNWRSIEHDSAATLTLCTQKVFASSSPGCLATPTGARLWASACPWRNAFFGGDYDDTKGKYFQGEPFDTLDMKSDVIKCIPAVVHSHDYSNTIQDFTANQASQTFDLIKNEAVVHTGTGHHYMAVCWQITYLSFNDPLNPTTELATAHDWKLILDTATIANVAETAAVLQRHYGGAVLGDNDNGGSAVALRGFYSLDSGDPKDGGNPDGQNGFGPCTAGPLPEPKKPSPIF